MDKSAERMVAEAGEQEVVKSSKYDPALAVIHLNQLLGDLGKGELVLVTSENSGGIYLGLIPETKEILKETLLALLAFHQKKVDNE